MPRAAQRPCATCRQVGCTDHVRADWDHDKPAVRIRGRKLQAMRMRLWLKAQQQCALCHRVILLNQMIRDHIIPLAEGGHDNEQNSQALCPECSNEKTAKESLRGRLRSR